MQQHGSKYFACRSPSPTLGMGSVRQNSTFSEHGHVTYQIKENQKCSNTVATIFPAHPLPPDPGNGANMSKFTFSEHGHVAYQIKGNHSMQQHGSKYFARRPLPTLSTRPLTLFKIQLFQNKVMLHIKLKRITNAATW